MKFSRSLKKSYEFRRLYAKGNHAATALLVVYCRKNRNQCNQLGITVGTKIGNAVHRNRVRRRLKEIYRLNEVNLISGFDIVIVGRVKSRYASYQELEKDFLYLCKRLGLRSEVK